MVCMYGIWSVDEEGRSLEPIELGMRSAELVWLCLLLSLSAQSQSCDVYSVSGGDIEESDSGCTRTENGDYRCALLQDALETLLSAATNCSEIRLQPNATYRIVRTVRLSLSGSLTITTDSAENEKFVRATISFALATGELNATGNFQPLYVLAFERALLVEVVNVDFAYSPGIVSFRNVEKVEIAHSSFRYKHKVHPRTHAVNYLFAHLCTTVGTLFKEPWKCTTAYWCRCSTRSLKITVQLRC